MKKTLLMLLLGIIIIAVSPITGVTCTTRFDEEWVMEEAVKTLNGEVLELNVNGWGKINEKFLQKQDMKQIKESVINRLNLRNLQERYTKTEQHRMLKISGFKNNNVYIEVILQSINPRGDVELQPKTYIIINAIQNKSTKDFIPLKTLIAKMISDLGGKAEITSCITVSKKGKLPQKTQDKLINKVFKTVDAKPVEGIVDTRIISRSAYTPYIKDYIKVLGEKVNLNIASRYNPFEARTYFWIGTPLIATEY